jgi:hypothetical protein
MMLAKALSQEGRDSSKDTILSSQCGYESSLPMCESVLTMLCRSYFSDTTCKEKTSTTLAACLLPLRIFFGAVLTENIPAPALLRNPVLAAAKAHGIHTATVCLYRGVNSVAGGQELPDRP